MKVVGFILIVLVIATVSFAYPDGPPDGMVGNPTSCVSCHGTFPVNSGSGSMILSGLPSAGYTPGEVYNLTLSLSQSGQSRWGFELSPVLQSRPSARGGTLNVSFRTLTQLSTSTGTSPEYLKHTTQGTFGGTQNGPVSWQFAWTAPAAGSGPVIFYFAGNAANNDNSSRSDYIYTRTATVSETQVNSVRDDFGDLPKNYSILSAYPNPFNPTTTIRVKAPISQDASIAIYDLTGRLVQELYRGSLSTDVKTFQLSGRNMHSGLYFVRIVGNSYREDLKLVFLK